MKRHPLKYKSQVISSQFVGSLLKDIIRNSKDFRDLFITIPSRSDNVCLREDRRDVKKIGGLETVKIVNQ